MKKAGIVILTSLMVLGIMGCSILKGDGNAITGDEDSPASSLTASDKGKDAGSEQTEENRTPISDVQALTAIRNYCYINNPDLKSIEDSGEATVYWDISSSSESEIVVMFRSYTAAQIRYYINRATGDTYVTEFVPEITDEEKRTDESFNVWDYADGEIVDVYEVTDLELAEEYLDEDKYVTRVRYFEMADGTWRTKYNSYKYRLEITGKVDGMPGETTFVYLSNIEDISFDQAYKAAGVSSDYKINNEDCFDPKDAVLVAMK